MVRVKVPQDSGSISVSVAGGDPVVVPVAGGIAEVPDELVDVMLRGVPGSAVEAAGNPGVAKEAK